VTTPLSARADAGEPPSRRRRLTAVQEDYVKALYQLGAAEVSVNTSQVAERLGVSAASVAEMLGKLATLGLVQHDRYRGAALTAQGEEVALEMVRHHRLLETYLVRKLGYGWDEVHEEAELLEHVISERMEQRMFESLGRPVEDCHGDPIPALDGQVATPGHLSLLEAHAGAPLTVRRVSDRDAGVLRVVDRLGLRPGTQLEVLARSEYDGPIAVRVGGRRRMVPIGVARAVFVQPAPPDAP
jgi:DtxR family transcriptional regulator, Mn-dependent transcriptional regulator